MNDEGFQEKESGSFNIFYPQFFEPFFHVDRDFSYPLDRVYGRTFHMFTVTLTNQESQ